MNRPAPAAAWLVATALCSGCSSGPPNPSLPLTRGAARALLREMRQDPKPLERPLVILGGLNDPGFDESALAGTIRKVSGHNDQVIALTFMKLTTGTFDGCRDYVIDSVERAFGPAPAPAPGIAPGNETIEVDVVGYSMGGLVARHAARPRADGGKRLKIHRLFTIATPHRGARLATLPTLDSRAADMRLGSEFLQTLDLAMPEAGFEIYSYTRTNDWVVGEENTAPPGQDPWWVPVGTLAPSHLGAAGDPRIVADIARRLRGEPPCATVPPAPLPGERAPAALVASFPPGVRTEERARPDALGLQQPTQAPQRATPCMDPAAEPSRSLNSWW